MARITNTSVPAIQLLMYEFLAINGLSVLLAMLYRLLAV